jgi:hypothetical protein
MLLEISFVICLQKGTSLNKDNIGHRYVELFRVSRAEALERLGFNGMPPFPQMMAAMESYMRPVRVYGVELIE